MYANPEQAFGGQSKMLHLVECIYDAAQNPALWPATLRMISEAIKGESIAIYAGFPDFRTPDVFAVANFTAGAWEAFNDYYATINPLMPRCEALFKPDTAWASDLAMPDAAFEKTEFYNDFFHPNDMHFCLGLRLEFKGLPAASLSCQRPKHAGAFGAEDKIILETLRPHLQRAFQLHYRISALEATSMGLEAALDAHDHPVVGLDRQGHICLSNSRAIRLLAAGDGLCQKNGRLCCSRPDENAALQQMITSHALGSDTPASPVNALLVSRKKSVSNLHLTMLPMRKTLAGRSSPLAALLIITDLSLTSSRATLVKTLYGVTPSEARIADLLLQGLDVREISEKLRITLETARFQVKRLLAKTGTRRQAELLRLLSALPGSGTTA